VRLTAQEVARAVDGRLAGGLAPGTVLTDVVVDSRAAGPGALFVALPGERVDGHAFADAAVEAGAAAVLASRETGGPAVVVGDPAQALLALAAAWLQRLPDLVRIGITGSSGKTTTKDLLADVLAELGETVAPPGSYNNEIGVPLTALRCEADTRFLVSEMGARGLGHIATLCAVVRPDVAAVLNVGSAHLGEFGSREAVAQAKGELVESLDPATPRGPGLPFAVLQADDPVVAAMAARTAAPVRSFGTSPGATVTAEDVELDGHGRAGFRLAAGGAEADVRLNLVGEHHVGNALAVAAIATGLGMTVPAVARALSAALPRSAQRMAVVDTADGITVVDDSYNANPESVRAALKALVALGRPPGGPRRRTVAVLGQMAELGDAADTEHHAIGETVVRLNIDQLVVVGAAAGRIHAGAVLEGSWERESLPVADVDEALAVLRTVLAPGDVVLVKGSRVAGLERVVAAVLAEHGGPAGPEGPAGARPSPTAKVQQ
jgi:UDP-N-acetylmuramoyl-tripeptide--D-alanyl-D-alanine ligase